MADSNIAPRIFDGWTTWATLSPEQQARIGALALEVAVGRAISEHSPDPAARAGMEAERIALDLLQKAVLGAGGLPDRMWIDPKDGGERFCMPSALGSVCTTCGCSEHDPCDEGCGWHDAVTCTACAEEQALDEEALGGVEPVSEVDPRAPFAEARIRTADGAEIWLAQDHASFSFYDDGENVVIKGRHLGMEEAGARARYCREAGIPVPTTVL